MTWQTTLTVIDLGIAVLTLTLGVTKAAAARRERTLVLSLTASVLLHAGVVFLLATPPLYRAVGSALHAPNLPALAIDVATLLCVGHAHYMALLWHPERHTAQARRRAVRAWLPFYTAAVTAMVLLYASAGLPQAARPLRFAPVYAQNPAVFALKAVYFSALVVAVVATMSLCRQVTLPDRPGLARDVRRCMRWFAVAVGLDLATAVLTLGSMVGVIVRDDHRYDFLADASWVATILSGIAANQSLGRLVLTATKDDRRDCHALGPLHHLVVAGARHLVIPTGRWNAQIRLTRMMMEIRDGARTLTPWMSDRPAAAVDDLLRSAGPPTGGPVDPLAAQDAATLLHAAACRAAGRPPAPAEHRLHTLPGIDVPAAQERAHLVRVAQHLAHPLVSTALRAADEQAVPPTAGR
ncbi:DUF6545 domain-containing protein [Streptomyces sp. NPDC052701]|uniref:DUF6545 domain-containing protein n=1 Tax=Streptomyces sp. NPDC052701 TaxID=3155533 RepID=UPI0034184452